MQGGAGMGWGGAGRGGSKNCKPILAPPRGVGLKSRPIPVPPLLRGGENPHGTKWGGVGQAGQGKIVIPTCTVNPCKVTVHAQGKKKSGKREMQKRWTQTQFPNADIV